MVGTVAGGLEDALIIKISIYQNLQVARYDYSNDTNWFRTES